MARLMTTLTFFKASISTGLAALMMAGCSQSDITPSAPATQATQAGEYPSLRTALDCLPQGAALMASHRGTSRSWDIAENSLTGLRKLIADGYKVAEIDIAGTKDGALFTYHDGTWEETSTGKGPVAASTAADLGKILLKTRQGDLTSERPPLFTDMLAAAKDRIYLEIDFKSSAKFEPVIEAIRAADMTDQVVLIAYSDGQAAKLARLAPDMLLSVPPSFARPQDLVWLGPDAGDSAQAQPMLEQGSTVLGRVWKRAEADNLDAILNNARLVVTDYIEQYDPIMGLEDVAAYKACLVK